MAIIQTLLSLFTTFNGGPRLIDGGELAALAGLSLSTQGSIVAHAGGGQGSATQLNGANCQVDTCASDNDSVKLPLAIPGTSVRVYNASGHTLAVFGQASNPNSALSAGDTIAASTSNTQQPTATGVTQATALVAVYTCFEAGKWKQMLSA